MTLAIFDLDNTLLTDDSDHLWGEYLCEIGAVDQQIYQAKNQFFYDQYKTGTLNINEFLAFALAPLAENTLSDLEQWRASFIEKKILPIIPKKSRQLLQHHRDQGHYLLIITATNLFVTKLIAEILEVDHLIATEPEYINGRYTGNVVGTPCFQHGKIERLNDWLKETDHTLEGSYFYSDSHNDIPLLEVVSTAIAVDPDESLTAHAQQQGWEIISLRD